jgi:hypothetical protein
MTFPSPFVRQGRGRVPNSPLLAAAWKQLMEIPTTAALVGHDLGKQLDFTKDGLSTEDFSNFFQEALAATKKVEPIVESGNKYGVSTDFGRMNGEILLEQMRSSAPYKALSEKDRPRADAFFSLVCLNGDLRNRNPLHPSPMDTAVLGNLVNFPKHIFGFPYGAYSMSGHESLSLCLYSYRQVCMSTSPAVLYVKASGEDETPHFLEPICERLGLEFLEVADVAAAARLNDVAVVMTSLTNQRLGLVSEWAASKQLAVHLHVLDSQFRDLLVSNAEPVHFELPLGVQSMTLHDGVLNCGYQLYRDTAIRDRHFDVPIAWQTAYMSPNEGGSGNSTPIYMDFCLIMLGWSALRDLAANATPENTSESLRPISLGPCVSDAAEEIRVPEGSEHFDEILVWAKDAISNPSYSKVALEQRLVQFQRNFVGGKSRNIEAVVTSGGTRSINLSFESVLLRARKAMGGRIRFKVVTGNPHLAVERAERRFQFELVRTDKDGIIVVDRLRKEIMDPKVIAVYAQTLSYTDGITDPLQSIIEVLEEENLKRQALNQVPVTLINDSCLAFSVLLHNDGEDGRANHRVLELTKSCITPTLVTFDAHKHLGADKGVSMTMGTPGTLSQLNGHIRVGAGPCRGELVRAIADLSLIGVGGYVQKYDVLVTAIDLVLREVEAQGMTIINGQHRAKGSTVFAIEDPSGVMSKELKKRGHGANPIYSLEPSEPERCQTGFQFSLTPYCLREYRDGKTALDVFAEDVLSAHKATKNSHAGLAGKFAENSLLGVLLSGGSEECWLLPSLRQAGRGREIVSVIIRRLYSGILDSGVVCSDRHPAPINALGRRVSLVAILQLVALMFILRRRRSKPPKHSKL